MSSSDSAASPGVAKSRNAIFLSLALIAVAVVGAFASSLRGSFVFDDAGCVEWNQTIRHLWPLSIPLRPPGGTGYTVEGRPLLNLSFAINYAIGGESPVGYHAANVAIHVLAAFFLFGIVRRTLVRLDGPFARDACWIALGCALLWALHPLQTESVSYIAQRAESLMGLFFLGSLFAFVRAAEADHKTVWSAAAIVAGFLSAASKEVAAALPLVVLLYDRTFVAGTFAAAWKKRRYLHLGLFASWLLVGALILQERSRGGTIGSGSGVGAWAYALSQSRAIFHYLRLCFWPSPLIFDYGSMIVPWDQAWPWVAVLLLLLAATGYALAKYPRAAYLGASFFLILAPTSSFVGGTRQMWAEHRLYLPLASVAIGAVLLAYHFLQRRVIALVAAAAVALGAATIARNQAYHDEFALYRPLLLLRPENPWPHINLGVLLADQPGHEAEAIEQYEIALKLKPDCEKAYYNLGRLHSKMPDGQLRAIGEFRKAISLKPDYEEAHYNLGVVLSQMAGSQAEAAKEFETALRYDPDYRDAQVNLAAVLANLPGRLPDAIAHYQAALRIDPAFAPAHNDLATVLAGLPGRQAEALSHFETAVRLDPTYLEAQYNLAQFFASKPGRESDSARCFEAALRLQPRSAPIHYALAAELERLPGRRKDAEAHYAQAARLDPSLFAARSALWRMQLEDR